MRDRGPETGRRLSIYSVRLIDGLVMGTSSFDD